MNMIALSFNFRTLYALWSAHRFYKTYNYAFDLRTNELVRTKPGVCTQTGPSEALAAFEDAEIPPHFTGRAVFSGAQLGEILAKLKENGYNARKTVYCLDPERENPRFFAFYDKGTLRVRLLSGQSATFTQPIYEAGAKNVDVEFKSFKTDRMVRFSERVTNKRFTWALCGMGDLDLENREEGFMLKIRQNKIEMVDLHAN